MGLIADAEKVAYSSVVGQSIMLLNKQGACIGQLSVINTVDHDHIADQVVAALKAKSESRENALKELADLGQEFDQPPVRPPEVPTMTDTPNKYLCPRCGGTGEEREAVPADQSGAKSNLVKKLKKIKRRLAEGDPGKIERVGMANATQEAADLIRSQAARIERLEAGNKRLREALEEIASDAAAPQRFYDSHGPQWTTPAGSEVEDTSSHLDFANCIAEKARAALKETQS